MNMPSVQDYINLLESQHYTKPKFVAWVTAHLNIIQDIVNVLNVFEGDFSLDGAVGIQLDIIGSLVGASRVVNFLLSNGSNVLDDAHYLLLIKATIAKNNWNGTITGLYQIWNTVFTPGTLQIIDHQDMTIEAVVSGFNDQDSILMVNNGLIIPEPMGVLLTIVESSPITMSSYQGMLVNMIVKQNVMIVQAPNRNTAFVSPNQVVYYYTT